MKTILIGRKIVIFFTETLKYFYWSDMDCAVERAWVCKKSFFAGELSIKEKESNGVVVFCSYINQILE